MSLEIMKEKFLKNEDLSPEELLIILEDIIDTALRNGKFDNNKKAFYTKQNYALTLNALLENQIEIPSHLNFKMENIDRLVKIEYKKDFKVMRNLEGALIVIGLVFTILIIKDPYFNTNYRLTHSEKRMIQFIVITILAGFVFLLRGMIKLKNLK
jgi:hypothetical protein